MSNQIQVMVFPDADEATACGFNYNEWNIPPAPSRAITAVVVKKGTQAGKATVDFISQDADGKKQVFMLTAEILASIVQIARS